MIFDEPDMEANCDFQDSDSLDWQEMENELDENYSETNARADLLYDDVPLLSDAQLDALAAEEHYEAILDDELQEEENRERSRIASRRDYRTDQDNEKDSDF